MIDDDNTVDIDDIELEDLPIDEECFQFSFGELILEEQLIYILSETGFFEITSLNDFKKSGSDFIIYDKEDSEYSLSIEESDYLEIEKILKNRGIS